MSSRIGDVPLSTDTATAVIQLLRVELKHDANFIVTLAEFHQRKPFFVEDLLEFIEECLNKRVPDPRL